MEEEEEEGEKDGIKYLCMVYVSELSFPPTPRSAVCPGTYLHRAVSRPGTRRPRDSTAPERTTRRPTRGTRTLINTHHNIQYANYSGEERFFVSLAHSACPYELIPCPNAPSRAPVSSQPACPQRTVLKDSLLFESAATRGHPNHVM